MYQFKVSDDKVIIQMIVFFVQPVYIIDTDLVI